MNQPHITLIYLSTFLQGLDDANASFSSGGGTGANTTSGGSVIGSMNGSGGSGGGKNTKGGKHSHGDDHTSGGNHISTGKTFHVEGFEGMEFTGNMDVVADGTVGNVTNVASSSSSSSGE